MSRDFNKYKWPNHKRLNTTIPDPTTSRPTRPDTESKTQEPIFHLQAKDSEWVDILQANESERFKSSTTSSDEEEMLQTVESEDGTRIKPLAVLFPGLLNTEPGTLQRMLSKSMSTTEVTRHLVSLGKKADFAFMKKANRLIPRDKKWLESLTEGSSSFCSMTSRSNSESLFDDDEYTKSVDSLSMNPNNVYALNTSSKAHPIFRIRKENIHIQDENQDNKQNLDENEN